MRKMTAATVVMALGAISCGQFGRTSDTDRWDAVYSRKDVAFNTKPNAFLSEVIKGRKPGKALDIGMGQGRNAILLAEQGWDVTGVDISAKGIALAREEAARLGLRLTTVKEPIEEFNMGKGQWDLIVAMYMHSVLLRNAPRIHEALKPGGILVVEGFHRDVTKLGEKSITGGVLGFQTNALLRTFTDLRVEHYEDTMGFGDWMNREAPIVRMVARKE